MKDETFSYCKSSYKKVTTQILSMKGIFLTTKIDYLKIMSYLCNRKNEETSFKSP